MKTVQLIQGTREWLAHRAAHWNASDAPAMLGVSPYKTRAQLLRELATGIVPDVDEATQRRFDDGHRFESLARPLAEKIVGEDLFPCVGVDGRYSASFDGISLMEDVALEHKSLNADLRSLMDNADFAGADLPEHYRAQMEHQCMVAGASRVLFMATRWEGEVLVEQLWCWYTPDAELRARIVNGWMRFDLDLANYQPEPAEAPKPVGRTPETLPALRIEARGMVTASNLAEFKSHALAVLGGINRTLATDEDFANAEQTVKWCAGVEDRLEAAKASVLAQMSDVDAVCRTIDDVAAEARRIRLELDKLVKAEKDARKAEIVRAGVLAVQKHYVEINTTMGEHAIGIPPSLNFDIGNAIKGLKTLSSIRDKISTAVAGAKIDASERAERVRKNIATMASLRDDLRTSLFPDRVQLCATKDPEDLRNLFKARIAEHDRREEEREQARQKQEAERLEQQREQIRKEEEAKVRAEFERGQAVLREEEEKIRAADAERLAVDNRIAREYDAEMDRKQAAELEPASVAQPLTDIHGVVAGEQASAAPGVVEVPSGFRYTPLRQSARLKLGDINAAIAPLSITCDGLMQLGIQPVAIDRSAKLYAVDDLPRIYSALRAVIGNAEAALTSPAKAA